MNHYVAFLRAVNVAGHASVKMNDVREAFAAAGCKEVRTYIQSGNVIFDAPEDAAAILQEVRIKLYVAFLLQEPTSKPRFPLVSSKEALQAVVMRRLEVFIISRRKKNGFYGFPNNFIEQELGVAATTRNWSTVTRIVDLVRREEELLGESHND